MNHLEEAAALQRSWPKDRVLMTIQKSILAEKRDWSLAGIVSPPPPPQCEIDGYCTCCNRCV